MILLIDDEPRYVEAYRDELAQAGYRVHLIADVDTAFAFLGDQGAEVELVILDIMMPPGCVFRNADTEKGWRTGVHLYRQVRSTAPDLPFIILTNVSDREVEKSFEKERNCVFLHKYEYLPFEVTEIVQKMIGTATSRLSQP